MTSGHYRNSKTGSSGWLRIGMTLRSHGSNFTLGNTGHMLTAYSVSRVSVNIVCETPMTSRVQSKADIIATLSTLRSQTEPTLGCAAPASNECSQSWTGAFGGRENVPPNAKNVNE